VFAQKFSAAIFSEKISLQKELAPVLSGGSMGLKFDPDWETLVETDHPVIAPCLCDVDKLDEWETLMQHQEVFGHHGKTTQSNSEQTEEGKVQREKEEGKQR
jgi:hypothetical protein